MLIVFNGHKTGWGNNGGTRTLIRCAEELASLGHDVIMCSDSKNNYTWHKPVGIRFLCEPKIPHCDVIVATGVRSVKSTKRSKARCKLYYIRGFETWNVSEEELFESYKNINCIVNSEWLKNHLASRGIQSKIIYPGLDFDWFQITNNNRKDIFGGLFHERHKTKRHNDILSIEKLLKRRSKLLNRDLKNASPKQLNRFYNQLSVWLATSELEGLHNPPMEASLCGASLVCTDHIRGGTSDYAVHKETALVYPARDLKKAAEYINLLFQDQDLRNKLNKNMIQLLKEKIGDRKTNMKKLINYIEEL